ncbi:MAG: SMP-30/gluconolactonase/LRE family protein [Nocardioidaceae bacterium]
MAATTDWFGSSTLAAGRKILPADTLGRIWAATGEGVHCHAPDGTLIGKLFIPATVSNIVFGGPKHNQLFVCATTSVYTLLLTVNGVPGAHVPR